MADLPLLPRSRTPGAGSGAGRAAPQAGRRQPSSIAGVASPLIAAGGLGQARP